MWGIEENRKTLFAKIMKRVLALIFLFLLSMMILISFLLSIMLSFVETYLRLDITTYYLITTIFSFFATTFLFFLIYKYLVDAEVESRDAFVGGIFTGFLFMVGKNLIGIYLARTNYTSVYGAAGSILGFLVWIYYSYLMFLFGAALTYTYAKLRGKEIQPSMK
jgi:membrane protein